MTLILSILARVVGGHLVGAFLGRTATGALYTFEHLAVGLGFRFFLGAGVALYFTEPTIRAAMDGVLGAVKGVVLG